MSSSNSSSRVNVRQRSDSVGVNGDESGLSLNTNKKRKRVVLSIQKKHEVLERLSDGEKPSMIADDYGISRQQVSDIKKNEQRILKYCSSSDHAPTIMKRKTLKATSAPVIEKELLAWLTAELDANHLVTNDLLYEKAIELFSQIPSEHEGDLMPQKASNAWMRNFKRRHGIRRVSTGDGYDGLMLPDDAKLVMPSPDRAGLGVGDSSVYVDPAIRALSRRVNSLEQVMQENVMHLEARIDEVIHLLQQQQNMK